MRPATARTALPARDSTGPSCTSCHLGRSRDCTSGGLWGTPALNHSALICCGKRDRRAVLLAACHGADLNGGVAGNRPATSCHLGGTTLKHPASFGTHDQAGRLEP